MGVSNKIPLEKYDFQVCFYKMTITIKNPNVTFMLDAHHYIWHNIIPETIQM